jgi:hypothetical protein
VQCHFKLQLRIIITFTLLSPSNEVQMLPKQILCAKILADILSICRIIYNSQEIILYGADAELQEKDSGSIR